ncbi:CGNR zinc finger domain-containing protein [Rhodococcus sp. 1168]|uniref:CGNR zinc finger domain-containing protein n=1 Tax=Rhodococcus sp. 1168 TaxID=2018041 RepID=UPI0034CEBD11
MHPSCPAPPAPPFGSPLKLLINRDRAVEIVNRKFCSASCGNRTAVAAYRARQGDSRDRSSPSFLSK